MKQTFRQIINEGLIVSERIYVGIDAKLTGAAEKDDAFQKQKIADEALEEAEAFRQKEKAARTQD